MARKKKQIAMNQLLLAATLVGATLFAGCTSGTMQSAVPAALPVSAAVQVCDSAVSSCTGSGAFSLGTVRDLSVQVVWSNAAAGTHTQQLEVLLPTGGLYQTLSSSFEVTENTAGPETVRQTIPIAGTWITQRELTGQWKVQVSLDGKVMAM